MSTVPLLVPAAPGPLGLGPPAITVQVLAEDLKGEILRHHAKIHEIFCEQRRNAKWFRKLEAYMLKINRNAVAECRRQRINLVWFRVVYLALFPEKFSEYKKELKTLSKADFGDENDALAEIAAQMAFTGIWRPEQCRFLLTGFASLDNRYFANSLSTVNNVFCRSTSRSFLQRNFARSIAISAKRLAARLPPERSESLVFLISKISGKQQK